MTTQLLLKILVISDVFFIYINYEIEVATFWKEYRVNFGAFDYSEVRKKQDFYMSAGVSGSQLCFFLGAKAINLKFDLVSHYETLDLQNALLI